MKAHYEQEFCFYCTHVEFFSYVDNATESGQRTIGDSRKATLERGDPRRLLTADDVE